MAASDGLKGALARLGLPERSYRSIRPTVTSTGRPCVYVGILNAGVVEVITAVLLHLPDQDNTGSRTADSASTTD